MKVRGLTATVRPVDSAFILLAVLIVVMLVSMIAVSVLFRFRAEEAATAASGRAEQGWGAAMAGIEEAMRVAARSPGDIASWQDNPNAFRERFVCDDGSDTWYFTVWSAADPADNREEIRYGLTDEASKLNMNVATETNFVRLPYMTASLAQAVMDFLDPDSTARPEGAEQEQYDSLARPYNIRNGPLSSVDEILLVRGMSVPLLYGEDANINFILDANENDGDQSYPPDNSDGKLESGLRQYLTVSSYEPNEDKNGVPRTNVNDPDDPLLPNVEFPAALTNYIYLMRSNNVTVAHAAELLEATHTFKDGKGKEAEVSSGVGKEQLAQVLDLFTASSDASIPGLLNVNTASAKVLATIPEIDEPLAEAIVSGRRNVALEKRGTIAWLYTEQLLDAERFKKVAPRLTARSAQFSFHVVGFGVPSGRYRVLEAIIDLGQGKPAITYLRDLTKLGMPFAIQATKAGVKTVWKGTPPGTSWQTARGRAAPVPAKVHHA